MYRRHRNFDWFADFFQDPAMIFITILVLIMVGIVGFKVWAGMETGEVEQATAVLVDKHYIAETKGEDTRVGISTSGETMIIPGTSGDPEEFVFILKLSEDRYENAEVSMSDFYAYERGEILRIEIVEQNAGYYVRLKQ